MKRTLMLCMAVAVISMPAACAAVLKEGKDKKPVAQAKVKALPQRSAPSARSLAEGVRNRFTGRITVKDEAWIVVREGMGPGPRAMAEKAAVTVGASIVAGEEEKGAYLLRWKTPQDMAARAAQIATAVQGVSFYSSTYMGAKPKPVKEACYKATLQLQIQDQTLHMGPLFRLGLMNLPTEGPALEAPETSVCRATAMGRKPVVVPYAVYYPAPYDTRPVVASYCKGVVPSWQQDLCADDKQKAEKFPQRILIHAKGEYPTLSYEGVEEQNYDSTYARYEERMAQNAGAPLKAAEGMPKVISFPADEGLLENIWVTDDASFTTPDGHPYAASCLGGTRAPEEAVYTDIVDCWVTYPLNERLTVKYKIKSSLGRLPQVAKAVDAHVRAMTEEWLASPAAEPAGKEASKEKK